MNRIYRLVWNRVTNLWVCCAENAKGRGKSSSGRKSRTVGTVTLAGSALISSLAMAAPSGGQISAGTGSIAQTGTSTTINQTSSNLAINWQSFGIAKNESVTFAQPSAAAIALNRVTGQNPSQILGNLSANGQVFILNPNGILIGAGSQVNVGGLVASTLSLSDADFIAGKHTFSQNPSPASGESAARGAKPAGVRGRTTANGTVVNQGTLTAAQAGYIALLAPEVRNEGVISATLGTAVLAAGNKITLNLNNGALVSYTIDQGALNALADNKQLIQADGGQVFMSAKAADTLSNAVVNNTGIIQARTIQNVAGVIKLIGDMEVGTVNVGGTLDASAPNGSNGGFIETSAAHVHIADSTHINTTAANGLAGTWLIDPYDFTIAATGGDITGAALTTALGLGAVTIQTLVGSVACTGAVCGTGTVAGNGDIFVNDAVSWSANKLTLNAYRNININSTMTATASASLALQYGQGAVALNNTSNIITGANGKVNLPAGTTNFTTLQGSNGVVKNYTVITSLGAAGSVTTTDLQGMSGNRALNYALGADIAAAGTSTWNAGAGFAPVGFVVGFFTGSFDGLGHTISNLTINRTGTNGIGLFGYSSTTSVIRNVGMVGGSVAGGTCGSVGGLVGYGRGTISNSYATGSVSSTSGGSVGGLVGYNTGTISNSYATGNVSSTSGNNVGGLMGYGIGGTISNSYATGNVNSTSGSQVGGLVGYNSYGTISNSYATGSVSGASYVGGLVGWNGGGTLTANFWDTTQSGKANGLGIGKMNGVVGVAGTPQAGVSGLTTAQMHAQASFTPAGTAAGQWNFTPNTGTWVIFEGQSNPLLRSFMTPLTITANNASKTYDGLAYNGSAGITYSVTPNMTNLLGTLSYTGGTNAGSYTLTPGGLYSNQQGYNISYASGTLTVNKANLTVTGVSASNKVYDATTAATLTGAIVTALGSDVVTLSGGTGVFANANVGNGKAVTVSGYTLSGAAAGNYTLVQPTGLTANITAANLSVTGLTASNKVYDTTTAATLAGTAAVTALGSDVVTLGGTGTGVFANANVGTAKAVSVSGYTLSGAAAGNYTLVQPSGLTANITAANLSVTGVTASNKVYDTTTAATLAGTAAVTALGSDVVTLGGTGTGVFANANVGTGKAVTVSGYTLSGVAAGNYTLMQPSGLTANITQASLNVTGVTASNKVYDATIAATLTGAIVTALGGDVVTLSGGTGVFANANVGTAKAVTISGYTLSGAAAGNYTLVQPSGLTANITAANLAVTGVTASNKVYDTTTAATLTGTAAVAALGTDVVTLGGTGTGVFSNANVGTGKAVTVSGYTLSGAAAGNYTLVQPSGLTANITQASLNVTGVTASNKVYDATIAATLTGAIVTALGSDVVTLSGGTGVFADANVGTAKAVTVSGYTLSGAAASNYTLVQPSGLTANITQASLNVTGVTASNKVYDTTTAATLTGAIVTALGSDVVTLSGGTGVFANANVGTGKAVTVSGYTLSGAAAGNYTLVQPDGLTADITEVPVTATTVVAAIPAAAPAASTETLVVARALAALTGGSSPNLLLAFNAAKAAVPPPVVTVSNSFAAPMFTPMYTPVAAPAVVPVTASVVAPVAVPSTPPANNAVEGVAPQAPAQATGSNQTVGQPAAKATAQREGSASDSSPATSTQPSAQKPVVVAQVEPVSVQQIGMVSVRGGGIKPPENEMTSLSGGTGVSSGGTAVSNRVIDMTSSGTGTTSSGAKSEVEQKEP